jgi:hypothetical protein
MQLLAALAILSSLQLGMSREVDASFAFHTWAHSYCKGGKVKSADIGSGRIDSALFANRTAIAFEHPPLRGISTSGLIPGGNSTSGMNCDELKGPCQRIGDHWSWCNYDARKCMAKYAHEINHAYSNLRDTSSTNDWVFTQYYDNGTPNMQKTRVTRTEQKKNSYSWTLSNTVSVGEELDIEVSVPLFGSVTSKTTYDVSTTKSSTQTQIETESWSVDQTISLAPMKTTKFEWIIEKVTVAGDFTAEIDLPDYAHVWCDASSHGHFEWFVSASDFMPQAYPGTCTNEHCEVTGKFSGWKGVQSTVKISECKLGVQC